MTARNKSPTWTNLVFVALTTADDFLNLDQLKVVVPGINVNQLTAAIHHLTSRHAIDCIDSGGRLWWFSTPEYDNRTKEVLERTPEEPGTRRRAPRIVK